jgi:1-acyl-sn-glycerol-3-phosphate acyltransferase
MWTVRVVGIVVVLGVVTLVLMPVQWLATRRKWALAGQLPHYWQKLAVRMVGIRIHTEGTPAVPPVLFASNHVSWLDVPILGSVLPVSFVAKVEVGSWPVIGVLAKLQRTVFIDRTKRSKTGSANEAIGRRVGAGDSIVLFAEGTTSDGNQLLPFRSALLGAVGYASGQDSITVQPVAVSYVGIHGVPVGRFDRPHIAWYGEMGFVGHFYRIAGRGALDVVVSFGEPIPFDAGYDRKKAAEECAASVRRMMDAARRVPLAERAKRPRPLFSPPAKGAKGAVKARPEPSGKPGERIASRIS